jgi:nucleoside-diphosphate-sugar epimerase
VAAAFNGFLGQSLVQALRAAGLEGVRSFDLRPHLDSSVKSLAGDLRDPAQVQRACAGVDTVFQTAAPWIGGRAAATGCSRSMSMGIVM